MWLLTLNKILKLLIDLGILLLAVDILILLPLSIFKKLRVFTGSAIFLSSYIFAISTWLEGFIISYMTWGFGGVVIGCVILGVGVVPEAILITILHGEWTTLLNLILMIIEFFVMLIVGMFIAKSGEKIKKSESLKKVVKDIDEYLKEKDIDKNNFGLD